MLKKKIKENFIIFLLGIILLIHSAVLTKLIYFPYPELFIYPYLTNHSLKPYSQILDQHFPGLLFLPINFDNLGMRTPEAAKIWSIGIVLIIHIMLFFIASKLLRSRKKALTVNILYLIWQPFFEGWVLWIDNFLPLFLLPAFYALYKRKIFISGLLLGLAIVCKQTIIPLSFMVLIYIFWISKSFKHAIRYLLGVAGPVLLMILYLLGIGVFRDFWYWTVIFNLTTYAASGTKAPPSTGYISRIVFVYGASLLAWFKGERQVVSLLLIFIVGSLLGAFERADFVHLQPSLPFVILATVYGLGKLGKKWILVVGGLYLIVTLWWLNIFYKGHLGEKIFFFDAQTNQLAAKVKYYTHPGEKIFVFGAVPHLYQMTQTLPSGDIFVFQFPWFLKIAEGQILEGIIRDKPNIVVSDRTVEIEGQKITKFADNIDKYISKNYEKIDSIGTTDILQRRNQ